MKSICRETRDIISTFINQGWRLILGPVILLLIPLYLTSAEQGCWYTFTSLAALSVFADLGFGIIVLQFAAHEFANLHFRPDGFILGPVRSKQRLASFFKFTVKWGGIATLIAFPIILIGGYFFLQRQLHTVLVDWQWSWILYSCVSGVIFFNNILLTFFEGCNSVAKLQSIRFKMVVASSSTMLAGLISGIGIYALAASSIVNACVGCFFLYKNFKSAIFQLWRIAYWSHYNWWPSFYPLMWRYAISWCSGYFVLGGCTPIAFYYWGPIEAGRVGLSIAMWTAGFGIANCWMTAITPRLNILVEKKEWQELDKIFQKNFYRTIITMLIGGGIFLLFYMGTIDVFSFWKRILDISGMTILFGGLLGQIVIGNWTTYLRAHKKEPLMLYFIVNSLYVFILTLICASIYSVDYMFLGFLSSTIWGIPFVWRVYYHQKKEHM